MVPEHVFISRHLFILPITNYQLPYSHLYFIRIRMNSESTPVAKEGSIAELGVSAPLPPLVTKIFFLL